MLLSFGKRKYRKRTSNGPVSPKGIYKLKDGSKFEGMSQSNIFFFDVQDREFTKTAKQS